MVQHGALRPKRLPKAFLGLLFLLVWNTSQALSEERSNQELGLHILVFKKITITSLKPPSEQQYYTEELASNRLPIEFSRLLSVLPDLSPFTLPGTQLQQVSFVDAFTFTPKNSRIVDKGKVKRKRNKFNDLSYELRLTAWGEAAYQIELKGKHQNFKFKNVRVQASRGETQLVGINGHDGTLMFAFTQLHFDPMTGLVSIPGEKARESYSGEVENPKLLDLVKPVYPKELTNRRGRSRVIVTAIVTSEGALDQKRILLLECPHFLLGQTTLQTVLPRWKFEPGKLDEEPVDVYVTIEVEFKSQ